MKTLINSLPLVNQGKVREIYAVDDEHLLIVTSDRISAFDVILPTPIPEKGEILTRISNFWFAKTRAIIPNHIAKIPLKDVLTDPQESAWAEHRSIVVKRLQPLPVEAIVRGYLIGSGWKDYQQTGSVCGIALPADLQLADKLPQPIFTPSTKATMGDHDMNINFAKMGEQIGTELAVKVRDTSLAIYQMATDYALERGIIIADTKFEFGLDEQGELYLIDEVLTPDSSRFWPADTYRPGISPPSFDKQFVRDYLETLDWDKTAPGPELPDEIVTKTADKYREAMKLLD
ncbi:MAG: phosphoribosylaminoimidazolesuccinocarboxamide synthase [Thiothrix sp.]|nr:MAG: phosphoribosylaminoimidazolesuccinocarboxamide synthase [Thiothrix sp.]